MPDTAAPAAPAATALTFSADAEPLRLRRRPPHVHGYAWRQPAPTASVVLVHGLQSHAGWFADVADLLLAGGCSVYALDRRGSGSSPGVRGDVAHCGEWLDEIDDVVRLARSEYPHAPVHLVGHCFGANLALGCALFRRSAIRSLVLLTPGLHIQPRYDLGQRLRIAAAAVVAPSRRFRVPQDDELFTRDPDVLAWIRADTAGARTLTARTVVQIQRMARRLRRELPGLGVPLLAIEAQNDRISANARNREELGRALGGRWRAESFDAEHFLLAEACRDDVVDLILRWISAVSTTPHQGGTTW